MDNSIKNQSIGYDSHNRGINQNQFFESDLVGSTLLLNSLKHSHPVKIYPFGDGTVTMQPCCYGCVHEWNDPDDLPCLICARNYDDERCYRDYYESNAL